MIKSFIYIAIEIIIGPDTGLTTKKTQYSGRGRHNRTRMNRLKLCRED